MKNILNDKYFFISVNFINFIWIGRIIFLKYQSRNEVIRYLLDDFFIAMLIISIALNLTHAFLVLNDEFIGNINSTFDFKNNAENLLQRMYVVNFFGIRPIPGESFLIKLSNEAMTDVVVLNAKKNMDLYEVFSKSSNFIAVHLLVFSIGLIGLYVGEGFNYGKLMNSHWAFVPIFLICMTSMMIYSAATLIICLFLQFKRIW